MKKFEVYDNFMKSDFTDFSNLKLLGVIKAPCLLSAMIKSKHKYNTFVKLNELKNE